MQTSVYTPNVEMVRDIERTFRDSLPPDRRPRRRLRSRRRHCRRRETTRTRPHDTATRRQTARAAQPPHVTTTIVRVDLMAIHVHRRSTILSATGGSRWPVYVPLGNAVLAGLGAVISQHVLVDGLRSREGRTHLFVQRAYHCGLAPYEGMRGGTLAGVVASGHGGIVVARTMTFAAGYPKFVLAPIAPKGRGRGGYDSGY